MLRLPILFKVTSNLDKAIEKDNSFANTNQEQYDISPYKVSDDEEDDDDDDDVPNSKIIPSWARFVTQFYPHK